MQQRKRIPLPVKLRAPNLLKPHMPIKRDALRVLLIHIYFIRAKLRNSVIQEELTHAPASARIVNEQHFNAVSINTYKAVNNASIIAGNHDLKIRQIGVEQ